MGGRREGLHARSGTWRAGWRAGRGGRAGRARLAALVAVAALAPLGRAQQLPEGVFVASAGYAVVDSGFDRYDNSSNSEPKLLGTGFGPLYFGALLASTGGVTPPGVTQNFSNVDLRTRGDAYSVAGHYGVTDELTVGAILRFVDVRTNIRGEDTTDFAVLSNLVKVSGSVVDEAELNDELLQADLEAKWWFEDQYLDDDTRYKAAWVFGYTHRGAVNIRENLVRFALVELARMNRPPYLRAGYEGLMMWGAGDEPDVVQLSYGFQGQYHLEGDTNNANPAAILANLQTGGAAGFTVIDDVRSEAHLGAEAFVRASTRVWRGLSLGTGLSWHYEEETDFDRVRRTGTPTDAFLDTGRDTEERAYLHAMVEYDAIDEFQRGEWSIPWTLRLEVMDSFYGRNLSELSVASLRLSVPLSRPTGSTG